MTNFLWELINCLHIYFLWKTLTSWFHNSQAEYLYPWQIRQNISDTFKTHLFAILRTWSSLIEKCLFFSANKVTDLALKKDKNLLAIISTSGGFFVFLDWFICLSFMHLHSNTSWTQAFNSVIQLGEIDKYFSNTPLFSLSKFYWTYSSCTWKYLWYISILNAVY